MKLPLGRYAVLLVVAVAVAGAAFRVITAPDRIKARQATARAGCTANGGQWLNVDGKDMCVKPDAAKR
jgi:hypothetical protein